MAGGRVDLVRAGFHLWASMYRHSKTALLVTLLRTYLVLLFLAALGGGTSRHSLAAQALASLLITTTVDSMWDMAGSLLAQRLAGVLTYAALAPRRLSEVVLLTYMPRYLAEAALKALSLAPVLIALAGADGLVLLGVALALGLVGALPLAGIGLLVAMLTLLAREEAPWLDWLAPLLLILSGAVYPVTALPGVLRLVALLLPTTYLFQVADLLASGGELGRLPVLFASLAATGTAAGAVAFSAAGRIEARLYERGGQL